MAAIDVERQAVGKYATNLHDVSRDFMSRSVDTENLNAKAVKPYPLSSWVSVLFLLLVVGMYILSPCLKQNGSMIASNLTNIVVQKTYCQDPGFPLSEVSSVHYPEPVTYSRFFAILSMQRPGSGWFETLLNSHINISSNGKIFFVNEQRSNISSIIATLDKIYNLDWFSSASKNECTSAVGLKWMLNQKVMDVLTFRRLPERKLASQHVKIHRNSLSDQIENWDAVSRTLNRTEFESFAEFRRQQ